MAVRTWGGGTNNPPVGDANVAANWTGDTVPTTGDTAVLDNTADTNCNISAAFSCDGLTLAAGYDGSITGSGTVTLGSSGLTVNSGTYSGTGAIDCNGPFALGGGTMNAPAAMSVSGSWTKTGGVFNSGTGTVTLDSSVSTTLTPGGTTADDDFYNLVFSLGSGINVTLAGDLKILNNPTFTFATNSGTYFDAAGYNVTIGGNCTGSSGDNQSVKMGSGTWTVAGNFTSDGLFMGQTSTLVLTGTSKTFGWYPGSSSQTTRRGYNVTVQSGASYQLDFLVVHYIDGVLTADGAITSTGTGGGLFIGRTSGASTADVHVGASGSINVESLNLYDSAIDNWNTADILGTVTIPTIQLAIVNNATDRTFANYGTINYGSTQLTIVNATANNRVFTIGAGTFTATTLKVNAPLAGNCTVDFVTNGVTCAIAHVDYIGAGSGSEVILASSGTWTASSGSAQTFDLGGGVFTPSTGKVVFAGAGTLTLTPPSTGGFYNMTLGQSKTHNVAAGSTMAVSRILSSDGTLANPSVVQSTSAGTAFNLNFTGFSDVYNRCTFKDCNATPGNVLYAYGSTLVSGNTDVDVTTPVPRYWVATGASVFSSQTGWAESSGGTAGAPVPNTFCATFHDNGSDQNMSVDQTVSVVSISIASGYDGEIDFNDNNITVATDLTWSGAGSVLCGNGTITVPNILTLNGAGSWTREGSTVIMSATGAAPAVVCGGTKNVNHLTVQGSISISGTATPNFNCRGNFVCQNSPTITIASGATFDLNDGASPTYTITGATFTGAGTFRVSDTSIPFLPTDGTISCTCCMTITSGIGRVVPARTYGGKLCIRTTGATPGIHTAGAGTFNVGGTIDVRADGAGNATFKCDTNNPTVNAAGLEHTGVGAGQENIIKGTGTWTISSNSAHVFDTAGGTFTNSGGNLVFAGTGTLTFIGNLDLGNHWFGATKTHSFTPGYTYSSSGTGNSNGAKGATASLLRSTASPTRWTYNFTGASNYGDKLDVQDSDASGGNPILAIQSVGALQNNVNWLFGSVPSINHGYRLRRA